MMNCKSIKVNAGNSGVVCRIFGRNSTIHSGVYALESKVSVTDRHPLKDGSFTATFAGQRTVFLESDSQITKLGVEKQYVIKVIVEVDKVVKLELSSSEGDLNIEIDRQWITDVQSQ